MGTVGSPFVPPPRTRLAEMVYAYFQHSFLFHQIRGNPEKRPVDWMTSSGDDVHTGSLFFPTGAHRNLHEQAGTERKTATVMGEGQSHIVCCLLVKNNILHHIELLNYQK